MTCESNCRQKLVQTNYEKTAKVDVSTNGIHPLPKQNDSEKKMWEPLICMKKNLQLMIAPASHIFKINKIGNQSKHPKILTFKGKCQTGPPTAAERDSLINSCKSKNCDNPDKK